MKKSIALLLMILIAVPSAATSAAKGAVCAMPRASAAPACSYCAPAAPTATSSSPTLKASCCRFLPTADRVPAQAGSVGATPKPLQAPSLAAVIPSGGPPMAFVSGAFARSMSDASPPQSPPTRTTHLQL